MPRDSFPAGVAKQLKWYVYRLIDPRNGETFYVGKSQGNRVFAHAKGDYMPTVSQNTVSSDEEREDDADLKLQRIKEIKSVGLDVGHVIHRHGIEQEWVAYEVEAALIDAYPGLTNQVEGHGSGDYGARHVEEIVAQYATEPFEVKESLMLIYVGRDLDHWNGDSYKAVQCAWKLNGNKANAYRLVLAQANGLVVGAYRPKGKWLAATQENFPGRLGRDFIHPEKGSPTRWGFVGEPANDVWSQYVGKRVPDKYRGAQNPVRYCHPYDKETAQTVVVSIDTPIA